MISKTTLLFIVLGALLIPAVFYHLGVRIHFDVLAKRFQRDSYDADIRKIQFKNGSTVVGEVVKENQEGLVLKIEGGSVEISAAEIESVVPLDPDSIAPSGLEDQMIKAPEKPWITVRAEDRLFHVDPEPKPDFIDYLQGEVKKSSDQMEASLGGRGLLSQGMMGEVSVMQEKMEQNRIEIQRQMRELDRAAGSR